MRPRGAKCSLGKRWRSCRGRGGLFGGRQRSKGLNKRLIVVEEAAASREEWSSARLLCRRLWCSTRPDQRIRLVQTRSLSDFCSYSISSDRSTTPPQLNHPRSSLVSLTDGRARAQVDHPRWSTCISKFPVPAAGPPCLLSAEPLGVRDIDAGIGGRSTAGCSRESGSDFASFSGGADIANFGNLTTK